jgi:hypothetical protein
MRGGVHATCSSVDASLTDTCLLCVWRSQAANYILTSEAAYVAGFSKSEMKAAGWLVSEDEDTLKYGLT